jgi:hypothetical protein
MIAARLAIAMMVVMLNCCAPTGPPALYPYYGYIRGQEAYGPVHFGEPGPGIWGVGP